MNAKYEVYQQTSQGVHHYYTDRVPEAPPHQHVTTSGDTFFINDNDPKRLAGDVSLRPLWSNSDGTVNNVASD